MADAAGRPVYHTNVLMCVATEFAMVGFDMLTDPLRAVEVRARLEESGRQYRMPAENFVPDRWLKDGDTVTVGDRGRCAERPPARLPTGIPADK